MKIHQSKRLNVFKKITHAFTTRDSGNLAFHVGDDEKTVLKNHSILAKHLSYSKKTLVHMKQIHSNIVHIVDERDNFLNPPTCDALITNKTNTPLMVMVADCSPVLFYDEKKRVIAVAHAGREGAFKNILKNVVESFARDFGSDAKDIVVASGPSIGVCCYEVGVEIKANAQDLGFGFAIKKRDNAIFLDIAKILKSQLLAFGIKESNIEISDECSCCKSSKYFSYRASGVTGRFAGVLMMRD